MQSFINGKLLYYSRTHSQSPLLAGTSVASEDHQFHPLLQYLSTTTDVFYSHWPMLGGICTLRTFGKGHVQEKGDTLVRYYTAKFILYSAFWYSTEFFNVIRFRTEFSIKPI